MNFLIQVIDQASHDFVWVLRRALDFYAWQGNPCRFANATFERLDQLPIYAHETPVGTVEFVHKYIEQSGRPTPPPLNVPVELFGFAGREIWNGTQADVPKCAYFAKRRDIVKADVIYREEDSDYILPPIAPGPYQFSTYVDFTSEWRAFVWRGELVGLQNYLGDFTEFPDVSRIAEMVAAYKSAPCAYTLDVGLIKGETCVVEVHNFYSCGLYGFENLQLLPLMLAGWYKEYTRQFSI